jgi:hypothetical protein
MRRWRIVALASFVALGIFVMPDGAPMREYAGLAQRAMVLLILSRAGWPWPPAP